MASPWKQDLSEGQQAVLEAGARVVAKKEDECQRLTKILKEKHDYDRDAVLEAAAKGVMHPDAYKHNLQFRFSENSKKMADLQAKLAQWENASTWLKPKQENRDTWTPDEHIQHLLEEGKKLENAATKLAQAEKDKEGMHGEYLTQGQYYDGLLRTVEAQIERLREALEKYGKHPFGNHGTWGCPAGCPDRGQLCSGSHHCVCGLDDALSKHESS